MKKEILKVKEFELPVYSASVIFVYSNSFDAVAKYAEGENFHEDDIKALKAGKWFGYTFTAEDVSKEGRTHTYVFIKKAKKYEEIDVVSHEILHAVVSILTHRGLKLNKHNEEAYTYLNGYLNKEFFKFKDGK